MVKAVVEEVAYLGNLSIYRLQARERQGAAGDQGQPLALRGGRRSPGTRTVWVTWDDIAGVVLTQ